MSMQRDEMWWQAMCAAIAELTTAKSINGTSSLDLATWAANDADAALAEFDQRFAGTSSVGTEAISDLLHAANQVLIDLEGIGACDVSFATLERLSASIAKFDKRFLAANTSSPSTTGRNHA